MTEEYTLAGPSGGSMPVLAPISAPILRSVDPVKVAKFLKERERYEIEVESKQAEVPSLKPLAYTASIDRTLLKSIFYMIKFDTLAPTASSAKDLTDANIHAYVKSLVSRTDDAALDPTIIKSALSGFAMPTKILDAKARIMTYCADFFERLESVGCVSFPEDNPKKTVRLLCSRLQRDALKKEMRERLDFDGSLEKNFKSFMKIPAQEAINSQAYTASKPSELGSSRRRTKESDHAALKSGAFKQKPICLYPSHKEKGLRHYLKDCWDCPKEQKDKLFEELRSKKDGVKRTTDHTVDDQGSTVLFNATFDGKFRTTVCADIGSAATLMDSKTLSTVQKAGFNATVTKLNPPKKFEMAAKNPDGTPTIITCTHAAVIDTELHIRHGSALFLRNLRWLVTPQAVEEPLLSRPLLEALGFDCHRVIRAAADRFGGSVDVSTLVGNEADFGTGRIGRVADGVFHPDGGADDADLDEDDGSTWALRIPPKRNSSSKPYSRRPKSTASQSMAGRSSRNYSANSEKPSS